MLDLLVVLDNTGDMASEQINIARNFPKIVEQLQQLEDRGGNPVNPDVHIMFTTTDMGHPLCDPFKKPDYEEAKGSPISTPCTDRIPKIGIEPPGYNHDPEYACTDFCTAPVGPSAPYIHFNGETSNIPGGDVSMAVSCLWPQFIDGCGIEAPLESMLQALDPDKPWNDGTDGVFLRDGAALAIMIITGELDCSVRQPEGNIYFDYGNSDDPEITQFWGTNPDTMLKEPTSAVCWHAGVDCQDNDLDGEYESCTSADHGVLHDVHDRYIRHLRGELVERQGKRVVMLGVLGVPPVTEHSATPPYEPIAGGVADLRYRDWREGVHPEGDFLPNDADETVEKKQFYFGVGPGCTDVKEREGGEFIAQALPPVRIREVCESLNITDDPDTPEDEARARCCLESLCSEDFFLGARCLNGLLSDPRG